MPGGHPDALGALPYGEPGGPGGTGEAQELLGETGRRRPRSPAAGQPGGPYEEHVQQGPQHPGEPVGPVPVLLGQVAQEPARALVGGGVEVHPGPLPQPPQQFLVVGPADQELGREEHERPFEPAHALPVVHLPGQDHPELRRPHLVPLQIEHVRPAPLGDVHDLVEGVPVRVRGPRHRPHRVEPPGGEGHPVGQPQLQPVHGRITGPGDGAGGAG